MVILENIDIDIDKEILQNIDKISNRFKFGISNRANPKSTARSAEKDIVNLISNEGNCF